MKHFVVRNVQLHTQTRDYIAKNFEQLKSAASCMRNYAYWIFQEFSKNRLDENLVNLFNCIDFSYKTIGQ